MQNAVNFGGVWLNATFRDVMSEKFQFPYIEFAFASIAIQLSLPECSHDYVDMFGMFCHVVGPYHDVIEVYVANFPNLFS